MSRGRITTRVKNMLWNRFNTEEDFLIKANRILKFPYIRGFGSEWQERLDELDIGTNQDCTMEMAMKDTSCTRLIGDVEYQPENDTNKQVWSRVKEVHGTILINGVAEERLGLPKGLVVRGWARTDTTTRAGGLDFHEYVEIEQGTGSSFIGIEAVIITVGINIAIIAICFILIIGIKNSKRKRRHMEADAHQMVYQVYDDVVPVIEGETPVYEETSQRTPDAHASEEKKSAEDSQSYDASDTKGVKVVGAPSDKHAKSAST
nr:unnamed protein product [Haemonchus contortus]